MNKADSYVVDLRFLRQYGYMSIAHTNRIAELRKARGLSQAQLAEMLKVHWVTVSKLERGKMQLTAHWLEQIASALKVGVLDLLDQPDTESELLIAGHVSAGGKYTHNTSGYYFKVVEDNVDIVSDWLLVKTDDLAPIMRSRDMVRISQFADDEFHLLTGRLAAIETKTLSVIGSIEVGSRKGLFNVHPLKGKPILDQKVVALGIVTSIKFLSSSSREQEADTAKELD